MTNHAALTELVDCPCGRPAMISAVDSAGRRSAHCDDEECYWSIVGFTDEDVIERWNRRSQLRTAASEGVFEKLAAAQESLPMDMQEAASRAFPGMLFDAREVDGWKHWSILERAICTAIDAGTIRLENGKIVAVCPPEVARDAGREVHELVDAAEEYATSYDGDERDCIKTDVLNAFFAGSQYEKQRAISGAAGER